MKYVKKPIVVEAVQWTGKNLPEVVDFAGDKLNCDMSANEMCSEDMAKNTINELYIDTLEGTMHISVMDYIIKGVKGELYPCKPDIFLETYEVEGAADSTQVDEDDSGINWGDKKLTIIARDFDKNVNVKTDVVGFNQFEALGLIEIAKQQFLQDDKNKPQ